MWVIDYDYSIVKFDVSNFHGVKLRFKMGLFGKDEKDPKEQVIYVVMIYTFNCTYFIYIFTLIVCTPQVKIHVFHTVIYGSFIHFKYYEMTF